MTSARPDTRYLATAPITTDLGQRLTDLTVAAPGGYELASARTAIDGTGSGRALELLVEIDTATAGILVTHGTVASPSYRVQVSAGGIVEALDAGGVLAALTAPNVGALAQDYVVAWSTELNAATDGSPGQALRSTLLVYDVGGDALDKITVVHAVDAASPAETFTVGGAWDGAIMQQPYALAIDAVRVSCRYHTPTETREHFVAATPAPSPSGPVAVQLLPQPAAALETGRLAGPGYQSAALSTATGRDRHRLVGPVWQWAQPQAGMLEYADDIRDTLRGSWVRDEADGYQTAIHWLARRQIPRHCGHVHGVVQVSTWALGLGPVSTVDFLLSCANGPPHSYTQRSTTLVSRTVDDGGAPSVGELLTWSPVAVPRDEDGFTWIWLSTRTDGGSGAGNAGYAVRSIAVAPIVLAPSFEGLPADPWGP